MKAITVVPKTENSISYEDVADPDPSTGTILVEAVFSYPGIGLLTANAIKARDYPVLQGAFMMITVSVIVFNLLADLYYFRLDPRITT